ncbi:hypothetical protein GGR43_003571 [Sphingobium jiangsuense]|uniref:DUF2213 domain-containing protein n=2 Tax=Sphingobium jiangsuense TaxID=870476 RepID=A0A7W6BU12_9SPHN|nr:DUF2213 domain-containing protein [Sphingobium jiangsuense]MBB3927834.1 hypothetical protein [Sphingobium jiangsuense]
MVLLTDTLDASNGVRICADGALVAEVFAARTGLQDYLGREVDPYNTHGLRDKAIVKVYRPENEVFKTDSLATYAAAPVTIDHPPVAVTADNWRRYGRGEVHGDVVRDGQKVRVPIIIRDADAVSAATTTHKQISMGYATELVFPSDGKHPDGTACDAYQTNIRINHIAFVPAARGGPELRVIDERPNLPPPSEKPTMKIRIGDAEVDATNGEAVRIAVDALNTKLSDSAKALTDAQAKVAEQATALAAKDAEIATLNQKVADSALTPAKLRDAAKAYAQVCDKAKALGVTFAEDADAAAIMKAVVDAKMGDQAKDWTADQIAASFAVLSKDAKAADPVRDAFRGGIVNVGDAAAQADAALSKSVDDLNAWRNQ